MSTSSLSEKAKAEFLLAGLRCARLRVQSLQAEIDEVGLALKHNMISPELAVAWLHEIGALQYLNPEIAAMPAREAA